MTTRFTITKPANPHGKWKISFGKGAKGYYSVGYIMRDLKRKFEAGIKQKTCVRVKYGKGYCNDTADSLDAQYLTYATACFLEDYLPDRVLNKYLAVAHSCPNH